MPAHNLLWRECEKTAGDVAARLACIPLVQEARGLDAGPRLVQKMIGFGDNRTSKIVARISQEEVAHVAVGVYWFFSVCQKMNRAPCSTFKELLKEYDVPLKGPFNYSARDEAGIPRDWYDASFASNKDQSEKQNPDEQEQLSVVYERLASIVAMECQNANMDSNHRRNKKKKKKSYCRMCCDGDCRPLGFLLGLPFAFLSLLISIVGVVIWIVGLLLTCICPCCLCVTIIVELALELIKAPIHVMEWFTSQIPC
ncbi:Signaling peptide TAXIMIN 1 [Linum grandiflorum]